MDVIVTGTAGEATAGLLEQVQLAVDPLNRHRHIAQDNHLIPLQLHVLVRGDDHRVGSGTTA